jgi:SAM-dependent methyltransferase
MNPNDITAQYYNIVYSPYKSKDITDAEISLINKLVTPPAHILDIGAGTGRHDISLLQQGYSITAIDSSKGMLKILTDNVPPNLATNLTVFNKNIYTFNTNQKFDLITMFWNTYNEVALTRKSALTLLKKLKTLLKSNARILINIDDSKLVDPKNFDFSTEATDKGFTYKLHWTTVRYNSRTNTSVSKEQIDVYKENKLVDSKTTLIKQRYWSIEELSTIADQAELSNEQYVIKNSDELYLVLSRINKSE